MEIERKFLGWEAPFLRSAARFLSELDSSASSIDLRKIIVVLPGSRATRRLLELLVAEAEAKGLPLIPPTFLTVGTLPEYLMRESAIYANSFERQIAWSKALSALPASERGILIPREGKTGEAAIKRALYLGLAKKLEEINSELSASQLTFGTVAAVLAQTEGFSDERRWQVLAQLHHLFLGEIERMGLVCHHAFREKVLENDGYESNQEIFLLACADLSRFTRSMLSGLSTRITALVFADQSRADLFDQFGCVDLKRWQNQKIPLQREQIDVALTPFDQSRVALECVRSFPCELSQVTIGVGDREVVPFLKEVFSSAGIQTRDVLAQPFVNSSEFSLLNGIRSFLNTKSFNALGTLIRHPAMSAFLSNKLAQVLKGTDLVVLFDSYASEKLPSLVCDRTFSDRQSSIQPVLEQIQTLLGKLFEGTKPCTEWGRELLNVLSQVYQETTLSRDLDEDKLRKHLAQSIVEIVSDLHRCGAGVELSAGEFISLVLERLGQGHVPLEPKVGAAEVIGWLELSLDDGEVLIVTGCNEGKIPEAVNADPFLPNSIRSKLGLLDNERRFARDVYNLTVMIQGRRFVRIIAGKQSLSGDPLLPSRLLFSCEEREAAERIRGFRSVQGFDNTETIERSRPGILGELPFKPRIPKRKIESVSVTGFGDYLRCPYYFYLKHVEKLSRLNDQALELDALRFGVLAHDILSQFAKSEVVHSSDQKVIMAWLSQALEIQLGEKFAASPQPAVLVQLEQLRDRLRAFAAWQAEWRKEGWKIVQSELEIPRGKVKLNCAGSIISISGRIDRIDQKDSGEVIVFDYKTGEGSIDPERYHRKGKDKVWINLQLPLYRYILDQLGLAPGCGMGFIALSGESSSVGAYLCEWSNEDLASAMQVAESVGKKISDNNFWPPTDLKGTQELAPLYGAAAVRFHEGRIV